MTTLALTLLCVLPSPDVVEDRVDLLHVSFVYDAEGRPTLTQLIFEDWSEADGRYQVVAWRLIKSADIVPHFDWVRGQYVTCWHDGNLLRKVTAPAMRTSYLQYDPELAERELLPKNERRELIIPRFPRQGIQ